MKSDLIEAVVEKAPLPDLTKKTAAEVVDAVFAAVKEAIQTEGRFSYPGFGTFVVKTRKERTGRNPRTNENITIPASKTVGFKAAPGLKQGL